MITVYPACFYKEKDGRYSVVFPDLNHLATCGDSVEEAFEMAVDCLAGYLYSAKMDNETVPTASDMAEIDINSEYDEYDSAFVNLVSVDVEEYAKNHFEKADKKTVTIPHWLNVMAKEKGANFSAILQNGLKEFCGISSD